MSVVEAVERDLEKFSAQARESTLAATALALAAELDDANSATSKSMCAKAMVEVMRELRALSPPKRESDELDELESKREQRRAAVRGARAATPKRC